MLPVSVIQDALLVAVHAQVLVEAFTVTLPVPPVVPTVAFVGVNENVQVGGTVPESL